MSVMQRKRIDRTPVRTSVRFRTALLRDPSFGERE
jgi:hypothetical protein